MAFRWKIFLVLGAIGLLPLLVLGWLSVAVNRGELEKTVGAAHEATALATARACESWIAQSVEILQTALASIPFDQLSLSETASVLRIPYRQLAAADAMAILDERGNALVPPISDPKPHAPALKPEDLDTFGKHIPLAYALAAGTAIGPPYRTSSGVPHLAVALRLGKPGADSKAPVRVVVAQLSLQRIEDQLAEVAREGSVAYLIDRDGAVVAGKPDASTEGTQWLYAHAPVGDLGWTVVVAQPSALALRPAERVKQYTLFWAGVTLVLVLLLGALLGRSLSEPIRKLSVAAAALTEGRYDEPVPVESAGSKDELGQFAQAFNHMAGEVRRRDEEIRKWNAELQQRVDKATADLKEASDQILRTRRLAALGSMAAGVAHELNNPLTALTGTAFLLRKQLGPSSPQDALLQIMVEQSARVAKIGADLRQFADTERNQAGRRFQLAAPVQAALEAQKADLTGHKIELETAIAEKLPEAQGDPQQLQQVVMHLVRNAIQAMPEGGRLTVRLDHVNHEALKLTVSDTGRGIPETLRERIFDPFFTTKDGNKTGVGLGLSIAHTVVLAHHGKLMVDSPAGQGATFTVILPAAAASAHLT
ncbi:MAG: HAMP domain-containing protein [Deltaproteobacteria bacterium]|nr:HAMP domain-containing protein [Deltaproteobacteria bacterium]